jgi:hypothetical protein
MSLFSHFISEAWLKVSARNKNTIDIMKDDVPSDLKCSLCEKLFTEAVSVSCCKTNYCHECITYSMLENPDPSLRMKCPSCKRQIKLEDISVNYPLRDEVMNYIRNARLKKSSDRGTKSNELDRVNTNGDSQTYSSAQSRSNGLGMTRKRYRDE